MNPRASMPTTWSTTGRAGRVTPCVGQRLDDRLEGGRVGEQRRDVLEHHPRLGEVRDVDDQPAQDLGDRRRARHGHFFPRLDFGCGAGWTRPLAELGAPAPRGRYDAAAAGGVGVGPRAVAAGADRRRSAPPPHRSAATFGSVAIGMSSVNAGTLA